MARSRNIFTQRFQTKKVTLDLLCDENEVIITSDDASKSLLIELKNELVYDGYADDGILDGYCIRLFDADPLLSCIDNLKEMIQAKLETMNYEVTFLS